MEGKKREPGNGKDWDAGRIRAALEEGLDLEALAGGRVLVLLPDGTRSGPADKVFHALCDLLRGRVRALDFLVALGTHRPMEREALAAHLGVPPGRVDEPYPGVRLFQHRWDRPGTFRRVGVLSAGEVDELSGGRLSVEVPVEVNRAALEADHILAAGPVFPHEVVGFSGGTKYLFPGIGGWEFIGFTHWLGALITAKEVIGRKETPVREAIDRAAALVGRPLWCAAMVVEGEDLAGLYAGEMREAWEKAVEHSARLNVVRLQKPVKRVLSVLPPMYDELWTGAKGMYKVEPVVEKGGEVIIYAPGLREISYVHGETIRRIGYHVRDYFLARWEEFKDEPWGVLAHSTHLRGSGTCENGVERPNVKVTLATGIPEETCRAVGLDYLDPSLIDLEEWRKRAEEDDSLLFVPRAGERLYLLEDDPRVEGGRP